MKIAVIGALHEQAQQFIQTISPTHAREHTWQFFDFREPAPLIEMQGAEFAVQPFTAEQLDGDVEVAMFFGDERLKQYILSAEDRGIFVIDLSSSFQNDSSVPMALKGTRKLPSSVQLVNIPSLHLHVYGPVITALHERFLIKRVAITAFTLDEEMALFMSPKMTDQEMFLINEAIKMLDDKSVRLTASILPYAEKNSNHYNLNVEFVRPFNMDAIRELLEGIEGVVLEQTFQSEDQLAHDVLIRRVRRDLSLDSGVSIYLTANDPCYRLFDNLHYILSERAKNR